LLKITVDIADPLLSQARKRAKKTGRPLRAVIEDGLRLVLRDSQTQPTYKLPDRSRGTKGDPNPLESLSWPELRDEIYGGR
jgi:hypothetical protein